MSATIETWKKQATKSFDARPILADGGEPFVKIMETAATLTAGETFLLTAPFEPVPLYKALGDRGFTHQAESVSAGEWWVLFTHA